MTDRLRIALVQLNQRIGDLAGNARTMLEWRSRAAERGAELVMVPELQLTGYPPEDLVLKPEFVRQTMAFADQLIKATADSGPALLFGSIHAEAGLAYNCVILAEHGRLVARRLKHELPNYGTFDEKRVFAHGPLPEPILFRGVAIGVPICEDIWQDRVCAHLAAAGAEMLLVPNGSPYETDKDALRQQLVRERVAQTGLPLAYLNRVGGQDELVFDGSSFVTNADGRLVVQLPDFEEDLGITDWVRTASGWSCEPGTMAPLSEGSEEMYRAMVLALRDYVSANGFPGVLLGLSGGLDSALSAAVAVDALGPDRVHAVMMPSRYTSQDSLEDAAACAELLGIRHDVISIVPGVDALNEMLSEAFAGSKPGLAEENIQSRLRMVTLMALSNRFGHMLLTTGNKSEMSVGYATLYGDMAGGYSVLKDAYKSRCFALARWRNANRPKDALGPDGPVMPQRVIDKPPTAELRPDQKDEDSLPPYAVLDPILEALVEREFSVEMAATATGADPELVSQVEKMLLRAEYKRRQAPPGVKLGSRNFGRDRRYPISNSFHTS